MQKKRCTLYLSLCVLPYLSVAGEDPQSSPWPAYRHDSYRSGVTPLRLSVPLQLLWRHRPAAPPQSAFPPPARQDFWHKHYGLKPAVSFDKAFPGVVSSGRVFYGSSSTDCVVALNARTGEVLWRFFTQGPVRCAPVVAGEKVLFGSDDGSLYCVSCNRGALLWRRHLAPSERKIPGNGRIISAFPVRGGPVVWGETVYAACGVFPKEGCYLCAYRISDGSLLYRTKLATTSPQGYLVATRNLLVVPGARAACMLFDRQKGTKRGTLPSPGGTFAVAADSLVISGPGRVKGEVDITNGERRERIATLSGCRILIRGSTAFLLGPRTIRALNRQVYVTLAKKRNTLIEEKQQLKERYKKSRSTRLARALKEKEAEIARIAARMKRCFLWSSKSDHLNEIIGAGDLLLGGGRNTLCAYSAHTGKLLWEANLPGTARALSAAEGKLFVSMETGEILCFEPGTPQRTQPPRKAPRKNTPPVAPPGGPRPPLSLKGPPLLYFKEEGKVEILWHTTELTKGAVLYGESSALGSKVISEKLSLGHRVTLTSLDPSRRYFFTLLGTTARGAQKQSRLFTFDAYTPFERRVLARAASCGKAEGSSFRAKGDDRHRTTLTEALSFLRAERGWCIILGWGCGFLPQEVARRTELAVSVLEPDPLTAASARTHLAEAGIPPWRVSVLTGSITSLGLTPYVANLVLSEASLHTGTLPESPGAVEYLLRPSGGCAFLAAPEGKPSREELLRWAGGKPPSGWKTLPEGLLCRRGVLRGAGQWSHLYADPANTASSGDTLKGPFTVAWFGKPGPRLMIDRHHRALGPLCENGLLVIQGINRLLGLDAYNGTLLYDVGIPGALRVNALRDCGHIALGAGKVFVAAGPSCVVLNARNGELIRFFHVPELSTGQERAWGYVAVWRDLLLGSCQKRHASLSVHARSVPSTQSYYDNRPLATGFSLFCLNHRTGDLLWHYRRPGGSAVINSTVACLPPRLFFVESTDPDAVASRTGRVPLATLTRRSSLVALNLLTGKVLWRTALSECAARHALFCAASEGTCLLVGSFNQGKHPAYFLQAFRTEDGNRLWRTSFVREDKPTNGDHGEQDQHPVLQHGVVYCRPLAFDLATGKKLPFFLNRAGHGCGALSACTRYLFGRGDNPRLYPIELGGRSSEALTAVSRPGCWINILPAGGLILIPEASSGCTCGYALQTSMALVPESALKH